MVRSEFEKNSSAVKTRRRRGREWGVWLGAAERPKWRWHLREEAGAVEVPLTTSDPSCQLHTCCLSQSRQAWALTQGLGVWAGPRAHHGRACHPPRVSFS